MTSIRVTKTRLQAGVWEGLVNTGDGEPSLSVTYLEREVDGVELAETDVQGQYTLRIPLSTDLISDGVQTILIQNKETGEALESITLIAGDALGEDIRPEIQLLRAELDMLKRAFRRHCVETS